MARRKRDQPRTPSQAAADRRSDQLAARLGGMLKDARVVTRLTQQVAANRAGISRGTWSGLEVGSDGRVTLATWNRAAMALGTALDAYVRRTSSATQPRDAVHLRHQEVIIRTAAEGGWQSLPEEPIDRDTRASRAADVLLRRGIEYALVEVWDWFDDVGGALRDWDRRLGAVQRYAIARMRGDGSLPRTNGCWVVRATQRNRRLIRDHRHLFFARFPGSGYDWLATLNSAAQAMPEKPGLLWIPVNDGRIFPARLG